MLVLSDKVCNHHDHSIVNNEGDHIKNTRKGYNKTTQGNPNDNVGITLLTISGGTTTKEGRDLMIILSCNHSLGRRNRATLTK